MLELMIFLSLVAITAVVGAAIRDVYDDDPTRSDAYVPPQSHVADPFGSSGPRFG